MTNYHQTVRTAYEAAQTPAAQQDPTLPDQIASQVAELTTKIAGPDVPGEDYLAKVGRLKMARLQAQEIVLDDLLPRPQDEEEVLIPPTWPTDPSHPLNDDELVEQMSREEIEQQLAAWEQSPEMVALTTRYQSATSTRSAD